MLARRKAQRLKTKLQEGLADWAQENRTRIPDPRNPRSRTSRSRCSCIIPACAASSRSHPGSTCSASTTTSARSACPASPPGCSSRGPQPVHPTPSRRGHRPGGRTHRRPPPPARSGLWIIDEDPLGEGDDWQDWPAFHRVATTSQAPSGSW